MLGILKKIFGTAQDRTVNRYFKIVKQVNEWDEKLKSLSDEELKAKTEEFKSRYKQGESLDDLLPEAFAVVKNVCRRLCGTEVHVSGYDQRWDMVPYDVQIVGAISLHKGSISEMMTGEGKTLTATLPLYLNALTGKQVQLVTVNDYLATRDCEWMGTVFRWLGLTTGALTGGTPVNQRKSLYEVDVLYGTASEFGFDYLRDNSMAVSSQQQVQRDYYYVIIDEVDSILIDEARTPLIISGPVPQSRQMYDELKEGVSRLVLRQRDFSNKLANESYAILKKHLKSPESLEEAQALKLNETEREALKTLWLVSKATPRNKVYKRVMEDPDMRAAIEKWDLYYHSDNNKQEKTNQLAKLFIVVDERGNEFELTDKGITSWIEDAGDGHTDDFVMMDIGHEFAKIDQNPEYDKEQKVQEKLDVQEQDAIRKERAHNLRQMLRAHLLLEKDVDYIVQDEKIVIIDENTGRPQPGRRFSDGLHQAIEAKEGVKIQDETQTYATITLQNFFRMYEKIAGMTGTAMTEAGEFKQIYGMDVLSVPTHRPCVRTDFNDEIYMSEREKYAAILKEIKSAHEKGRPILLGTESVDISEKLSRIFKQHNLPHTVLNAKNHEREAEIIAHAGQKGAITIATNMAGRGTDIKLGEGIADVGGLYVIGSTRHQSRRIDRQLRGRCARQGDPGSSKFFISFEDSLLRLFASPRMTAVLQRFRPPEGEPISAKLLNRSIETAQKRVEQRNYMMRKNTLEYDDVMNKQRQEMYAFRNEVLREADVMPLAHELIENVCLQAAQRFFVNRSSSGVWDSEGFRDYLMEHFPVTFDEGTFADEHLKADDLAVQAAEKITKAFEHKLQQENAKIPEEHRSQNPSNEAIRNTMIRVIDKYWQEHLLAMDHLRSDVNLRTIAQRDPLMEFKQESFILFDTLINKIYEEITHGFFRFELVVQATPTLEQMLSRMQMETDRSLIPELQETPASQNNNTAQTATKTQPVSTLPKVGRNDPCPCNSGQKYKRCCGKHLSE